jgi:hypothetical protein
MNIYSPDDYFVTRCDSVESMVVDVKGYYSSGESYTNKWKYFFTDKQVIEGTFSKNDNIESKFKYELNSEKRITKSILDFKSINSSWYREIYNFEISNDKIVSEKHFSGTEFLRFVEYTYDDKEYLTKIVLLNPDTTLFSYETANYLGDRKTYAHEVFNSEGKSVSNEVLYSNIDSSSYVKNDNGDIAQFISPTSKPDNNILYMYQYKYKYNNRLNWIERKFYINYKEKKELQSVVKRKIKYKK